MNDCDNILLNKVNPSWPRRSFDNKANGQGKYDDHLWWYQALLVKQASLHLQSVKHAMILLNNVSMLHNSRVILFKFNGYKLYTQRKYVGYIYLLNFSYTQDISYSLFMLYGNY